MSTTALDTVAWDLEPLVGGEGDAGCTRLLTEALGRAETFAAQHAGRVAELDGPGLVAAVAELAAISDLVSRAGNYASLRFSVDTADPEVGALVALVQERGTEIETKLIFFELEWASLDDARADELLEADGLDQSRHFLRSARRYREHLLTEPEEKILAEKSVTGSGAWSRLFSELTSAITVDLPDAPEPVALDVALSRLSSPDREVRRTVAEAVTVALQPGLRTRGYIFNTLLQDKATDDRLRRYPTWLSARNLSNEASDESVQALVEAVRENYDLPRRWYKMKASILGLERLADYDRMASVSDVEEEIAWEDAVDIVMNAYRDFSPDLADTARSSSTSPGSTRRCARPSGGGVLRLRHPLGAPLPAAQLHVQAPRRADAGHELGHGVHASLARPRGIFEQHTPLTLAETASVFGETLVFQRLLGLADTPESRLSLLASNIEDAIATVFRQTAMNQFEDLVHTARRGEGELAVERISELWAQSQEDLLGDAVEVTEGYRSWWSYVPHFIGTPGYVYAYAYGQLLALSVYGRYLEEGESFVPRYLEMLAAGGSKPPEELAKIAGLDLTDPQFWHNGLMIVRRKLDAAEQAAEEARRLSAP